MIYRRPGKPELLFGYIQKITEKGVLVQEATFDPENGLFGCPMDAKTELMPHTNIHAVIVGVDHPYCRHCCKPYFSTTDAPTCSPECRAAYNQSVIEGIEPAQGQSIADAVAEAMASKQQVEEGRDAVLAALKSVSANPALGQDAAIVILKKHCPDGTAKLSRLQPEHFAAVIAECKRAGKATGRKAKVISKDPDELVIEPRNLTKAEQRLRDAKARVPA